MNGQKGQAQYRQTGAHGRGAFIRSKGQNCRSLWNTSLLCHCDKCHLNEHQIVQNVYYNLGHVLKSEFSCATMPCIYSKYVQHDHPFPADWSCHWTDSGSQLLSWYHFTTVQVWALAAWQLDVHGPMVDRFLIRMLFCQACSHHHRLP